MPELPEVETVRRTLQPALGARVRELWHSGLPLRLNRPVELDRLRAASVGAVLEEVRRWGKYLLLDFAQRESSVVVHLGMSGRLRLFSPREPEVAHTHLVWRLVGGRELRFSDPRRFGYVGVAPRGAERSHPALARLGIDPLGADFGPAQFQALARTSRQSLKTFLLDQRYIAGIGNIYASEALWVAGVRPSVRANALSPARAARLARAVVRVLDSALADGGTSLRDFVRADGTRGEHREYLRVYDRAGKPCTRRACGGVIRRTVTQGRATFYCPRCQT